jgi:ADP-ribose pyrophosphatase
MQLTEKTLNSELKFKGSVIEVYSDTALLENGKTAGRDVVMHP